MASTTSPRRDRIVIQVRHIWSVEARGEGCPDRACARQVAHARAELRFGVLFPDPQVVHRCAVLPRPGQAPVIERAEAPGHARDGFAPSAPTHLIDCARRQLLGVEWLGREPGGGDRLRLLDARAPAAGGFGEAPDHAGCAAHAQRVAAALACAQAACAALNTWQAPVDADGDGLANACDLCPARADPDQLDTDHDGLGDVCDDDDDGDGLADHDEALRQTDPLRPDTDGDGWPDGRDLCPIVADDGRDGDGDGVGDACDLCPRHPDAEQLDGDGDGLGDACDCALPPTRDGRRCWDELTRAETGGAPGLLVCDPGAPEPVCRSAWPDFATWLDEEIFGPDFADGPEAWADYLATEITYTYIDLVDDCPPNAQCGGAGQRRRSRQQQGNDYEDWLCQREARRNDRIQCRKAPVGRRDTSFRTEALRWTLPAGLGGHARERIVQRPAGRLREADYLIPRRRGTHQTTVLGEAKCYNPFIEWNARAGWSWWRSVSFGTQLWDYINYALAARRRGERHAVVYHFCDFIPRRAAYETTAALAATQANGFTLRPRDSPPDAHWVTAPACFVDMANRLVAVAPELFACFVPGELAPDGVDPADDCTGLFYDQCSGSE